MVAHQPEILADLYDLLETQEDLWWDPDPPTVQYSEPIGGKPIEKSPWRILMNVPMPGYECVPRGSRALCLGFAVDMDIPEADDSGAWTNRRLRSPYLFIGGFPYILMTVGKDYSFDKMFRVISRFEDADPSHNL
jgi:hypothetical protein